MFKKVLVANRGAIACRIFRTLKAMNVGSVAVYTEADAGSLHVQQADEAYCIGKTTATESYLNIEKILKVAKESGAEAIHPGYGFLSESTEFCDACEAADIAFIGPNAKQISEFGLKHTARELAEAANVPLLPGSGLLDDVEQAVAEAERIGFPVMLKSTAGGGGIGMQLCWSHDELTGAFESVRRLGQNNFGNAGIFLEKYVERARHIEVQIFGDGQGKVVALGERDCSLQRRNQKVVEETPAPNLPDELRQAMMTTAVRLGEIVDYRSAGTVEYIYDPSSKSFYFLEVNTRLQVEHGVTEQVTGVDLVEWMVRCAAGENEFLDQYQHAPQGHAVQVRIYAEDPIKQFQPASGKLSHVQFGGPCRCDTWVEAGVEVPPYYDPMIAKLIITAEDRDSALKQLLDVLEDSCLSGIQTNLEYLRQVVIDPLFVKGEHYTRYLNEFQFAPHAIEIMQPGTQTMVQDYPGRVGYWDIGVPPSGPMDSLALRLGNRLLDNAEDAAALECTVTGPSIKFHCDTTIALTGAEMAATLNDQPLAYWRAHPVKAGDVLKMKAVKGLGQRSYVCIKNGIQVPTYLNSRSTFTLGQFGGYGGRALTVGDVLPIEPDHRQVANQLSAELTPEYTDQWQIRVLYGPHGAPDFFTEADIDTFFDTEWEVHYNSSRTGVRLIGPKPEWAREDGGEAGLHPSNIHDNAYAIGAVDFTGDMPVILGPDGPSLGGFVCPVTIIKADLWKLGQLQPGQRIQFIPVDYQQAVAIETQQIEQIKTLQSAAAMKPEPNRQSPIITPDRLRQEVSAGPEVTVCYRASGEDNILVEYGPMVLDLNLRFRVHALMEWLQQAQLPGLIDLTPGVRSLQLHFDNRVLSRDQWLRYLEQAEKELPAIDEMEVPTRVVHLPLSWDDPATQLAIEKYQQSVRKDAPWYPSNIEFIRRINGLDNIEQVKDIVFNASYLVMGLGDVYLGAPLATPVDPRHRLVTTKYNPARTWTPENAVGIGGAYLCIYGMEGPGGYQFVGRTIQVWNSHKSTNAFEPGKPWLLRFFDQIRFFPVSSEELLEMREAFPKGQYDIRVEEEVFSLKQYNQFLTDNQSSISDFKQQQQAAFEAERAEWKATGQDKIPEPLEDEAPADEVALAENETGVYSHIAGNLWQLEVEPGQQVNEGDLLMIVESMKMEIPIHAPEAGKVGRLLIEPGQPVKSGALLATIEG